MSGKDYESVRAASASKRYSVFGFSCSLTVEIIRALRASNVIELIMEVHGGERKDEMDDFVEDFG